MEEINKIINDIPVTIFKTNKFKSIYLSLYFKMPVTKEKVTYRNVLRNIMMESCNKYNTSEKLYINSLENYDAYYSASSNRVGNYMINSFKVASLVDRYTKEGNFKNVIDTFCEIVFNPYIKDGRFDKETFNIIIKKCKNELERIKEESSSLAQRNTYKNLNKSKAYTYMTELKYLDSLTPEKLYNEYINLINNSEISLIVCGDIKDESFINTILDNIKSTKIHKEEMIINNDDENDEYKEIIDDGNGMQNVLNIIMYLRNLSHYELNFLAPIYRVILGGTSSSRLFNIIREENSLAYYSFARLEKDDSLIQIIMGIEKENYDKTLKLTKEIVSGMNKITDKELGDAKKEIITSLLESQDNIENVVSREYNSSLFNVGTIDEFIDKINKVTKKEVENLASKLKIDMSYFLKGE